MSRIENLERKLYFAELALEHDRVRAIHRGIKQLRGELCKPHIWLDDCGLWICRQGMVDGAQPTLKSAWDEYCWYANQMEGAA